MRSTTTKLKCGISLKKIVRNLTGELDRHKTKEFFKKCSSVANCNNAITKFKKRLAGLKKVQSSELHNDTEVEAAQRKSTVLCVQRKINQLVIYNKSLKAQALQGRSTCRRTLDDHTLLAMLEHLINRCDAAIESGSPVLSKRLLYLMNRGMVLLKKNNYNNTFQTRAFIKKDEDPGHQTSWTGTHCTISK